MSMIFSSLPFPAPNPSVPNVLCAMEPKSNDVLKLDQLHNLLTEQNDIVIKLSQLLVKLHNASQEAVENPSSVGESVLSETYLIDAHDSLIHRLSKVEEKVDKIAIENGIDIKNFSELDLLEAEQNCVCLRAEHLNSQLEDCVRANKVSLTTQRPLLNVAIMVDPVHPPLSIVILLAKLRLSGRRVACTWHKISSLHAEPPRAICQFIETSLCLVAPRVEYELIVHLTWTEGQVTPCLLTCDFHNNVPWHGEFMSLLVVGAYLGIELGPLMAPIRLIHDQLYLSHSTKNALASLNNKLYKEVHTNTEANTLFGAFVFSCLKHSVTLDKINDKMKVAVDVFMAPHHLDV